jgi:UDP-N-acetylmuramoyl-tripeptide--D-alanyl-D-alanine ligase
MKADSLFFALRSPAGRARLRPHAGRRARGRRRGPQGISAARACTLPLLRVADPLRAAQDLAGYVRQKYRAINTSALGSAGKTTTRNSLTRSSPASTLLSLAAELEQLDRPAFFAPADERPETAAVFELAMSDPGIGEIDRLAEILKPDIAVLLNVFPVHLEFLVAGQRRPRQGRDLNHLAADGCALVNGDEPLPRRVARPQGQMIFLLAAAPKTRSC